MPTMSDSTYTSLPTHILGVDVVALAECHAQSASPLRGTLRSVQSIQSAHRLRLLEAWLQGDSNEPNLTPLQGPILETGCGQGDQSAALAMYIAHTPALHPTSVVHAVDPGAPEYGCPFTLSQAQAVLSSSDILRPYLQFAALNGQLAQHVLSAHANGHFRTLVASMCLWYFSSEEQVLDLFKAARTHGVQYVLLAEWALHASDLRAVPHVLAVLVQAMSPIEDGNVRAVLSVDTIKRLARQAGWQVQHQRTITPHAALHDGRWEVGAALELGSSSSSRGGDTTSTTALQAGLTALRQSLPSTLADVRSMDMWTAVLVPATGEDVQA